MEFELTEEFAKKLDHEDPLREYRNRFLFPVHESGVAIYLNGNSLGLQPKNALPYVQKELKDWELYAVEGHFETETPWMNYHEHLRSSTARLVGALDHEVTVMNTLTVNLHLLMVSFYLPTPERYKILVEYSPFPSDIYAIKSQIRFHGYDPDEALIYLEPSEGEIVSLDDIDRTLDEHGDELALVLIGGVNYYTGQVYPMEYITERGHQVGAMVGFDLAHGFGNAIDLRLHDWGVDFAAWCTYKYGNAGPGSIAGIFVHDRHKELDSHHPRFAGWWGHNKTTRFLMGPDFDPITGAEGWQVSNSPIFSMAPIRAALDIFDEVELSELIEKRKKLISFSRYLISDLIGEKVNIITPKDPTQSGCQLSISLVDGGKDVHNTLLNEGIYCDWREPDVIRIAFAPLYNNYSDVYKFVNKLRSIIS